VLAAPVLAGTVLAAGAGALVRVSVAAVPVPPGKSFILGSSSLVAPFAASPDRSIMTCAGRW
jgi:hypothetical protein